MLKKKDDWRQGQLHGAGAEEGGGAPGADVAHGHRQQDHTKEVHTHSTFYDGNLKFL